MEKVYWYKLEEYNWDLAEWSHYGHYQSERDARIDREYAFAEDSAKGERRKFRLTEYRIVEEGF